MLAAGFIWSVIEWRERTLRNASGHPVQRIAEFLGQDRRSLSPETGTLHQFISQPRTLLVLLKSKDEKERDVGAAILSWYGTRIKLVRDDLPEFVGYIRSNPNQKPALVRVVTSAGAEGFMALADLYKDSLVLRDAGFWGESFSFHSPQAGPAIKRVAEIAADSSAPLANRLAALKAIESSGENGRVVLPMLEALSAGEPSELGKGVRMAIAGIRREPNSDLIAATIEDLRRRAPQQLKEYLREIGEFGEAARDAGPIIARQLKPLDFNQGQYAAIVLAQIGYREAIPQLIDALRNDSDWHFVAGVVEALGRFKAKEAEASLRQLADTTFFPALSWIASNALLAIEGKYDYSDRYDEMTRLIFEKREEPVRPVEEFKWWEHVIEIDYAGIRRDFHAGWVGLISPRVARAELQSWDGQKEIVDWIMLPRHRMALRGGVFLGYDEGEFGGGLVFWTKDSIPKILALGNVVQILAWPGGAIVIREARNSERIAYKIGFTPDGSITAEPFKRLSDGYGPCTLDADGALRFDDRLRLRTDGRFERIR